MPTETKSTRETIARALTEAHAQLAEREAAAPDALRTAAACRIAGRSDGGALTEHRRAVEDLRGIVEGLRLLDRDAERDEVEAEIAAQQLIVERVERDLPDLMKRAQEDRYARYDETDSVNAGRVRARNELYARIDKAQVERDGARVRLRELHRMEWS